MMGHPMERRILSILLVLLLLSMGLFGLRICSIERALAEPRPRPVSDGLWSGNVKVNDDPGSASTSAPSIAVDANGNAYAVWHDTRNGLEDIYFSYRPASGIWGTNERVNDDPDTGLTWQFWPAIAVHPSGTYYAVWGDNRNGNGDIYFSWGSGLWVANVRVNDDPGSAEQGFPDIAVDANGNAYAVWDDNRNSAVYGLDIYFSYRPAAGNWGPNVWVNDDPGTADQYSPAIAVDASGNAYAVWIDERNGGLYGSEIYFSYRPAGGNWGPNVRVNDDTGTANQGFPDIAVDPAGNAYAVWTDPRNGNDDIYFSYRLAGGSWGANVKVNDDGSTADQYAPAIAVDPSGNAYAVWTDLRNGNRDIYFSYRPTGGNWRTNVKVNDDPGSAWQGFPDIAVDANGNAYAVWRDYRNGGSDIYFSYLTPVYEIYLPLTVKNY